jgi:hypothetical protein
MNWMDKISDWGLVMNSAEIAFTQYHNLAMEIAEECDLLIDSQKEVAALLDNLRSLLAGATRTTNGYTVHIPEISYLRIMSSLSATRKHDDSETIAVQRQGDASPSLGKRSA